MARLPSSSALKPLPRLKEGLRSAFARPEGGGQVFWTSQGRGSPAILLCDGLGCDGFIWRYLAPALARTHRVLHWHYPGHGKSPPPPKASGLSVPSFADDAVAVLDAARARHAVVVGHSMGVQVALEMHRRHPGRILGLVLVCGSPGHPLDTFHNTSVLRRLLPVFKQAADAAPRGVSALARAAVRSGIALELALRFEVNSRLIRREDLEPYFEHFLSMDPRFFVRALRAASAHSAEDHLPAVNVPTLVVGGTQDRFTPPWLSRRMALAIPKSELLMVQGGSHTAPLEAPEQLERTVADFLRKRVQPCDTGSPSA
jgi:pimeloyl-ACP methyl ester carboxylesterase